MHLRLSYLSTLATPKPTLISTTEGVIQLTIKQRTTLALSTCIHLKKKLVCFRNPNDSTLYADWGVVVGRVTPAVRWCTTSRAAICR